MFNFQQHIVILKHRMDSLEQILVEVTLLVVVEVVQMLFQMEMVSGQEVVKEQSIVTVELITLEQVVAVVVLVLVLQLLQVERKTLDLVVVEGDIIHINQALYQVLVVPVLSSLHTPPK